MNVNQKKQKLVAFLFFAKRTQFTFNEAKNVTKEGQKLNKWIQHLTVKCSEESQINEKPILFLILIR